jgi:hypothetical protein
VQDVLTQHVRKPLRRYQAWIGLECPVLREHQRTDGRSSPARSGWPANGKSGPGAADSRKSEASACRFPGRTRNEQGEQLWNVLLPFPQCGHI